MDRPGCYRTFIRLDMYERWILRVIQYGLSESGHKRPPMSKVVRGVIREYWAQFEKDADPEKLEELKGKVPLPKINAKSV